VWALGAIKGTGMRASEQSSYKRLDLLKKGGVTLRCTLTYPPFISVRLLARCMPHGTRINFIAHFSSHIRHLGFAIHQADREDEAEVLNDISYI
jgi:hypothetical protein